MLFVVYPGIVALILLVAAQDINKDFNTREKSKSLAKSLRRQLMIDNYDYSQEVINITEKESSNNRRKEKKARKNFYVSDLTIHDEEDEKRNFQSKSDDSEKNKNKNFEYVVSKKDLLYYIDDETVATENTVKVASSARYKLLKVRHQYRRSGQARLIQEENKDGVAILNLDKGPFPELRLPNSRRQYMYDHGDVMTDDEEVPPPAVNTSDPEAAADEIENITETEVASVMTTNKYS